MLPEVIGVLWSTNTIYDCDRMFKGVGTNHKSASEKRIPYVRWMFRLAYAYEVVCVACISGAFSRYIEFVAAIYAVLIEQWESLVSDFAAGVVA